jgi:hypothetical protein
MIQAAPSEDASNEVLPVLAQTAAVMLEIAEVSAGLVKASDAKIWSDDLEAFVEATIEEALRRNADREFVMTAVEEVVEYSAAFARWIAMTARNAWSKAVRDLVDMATRGGLVIDHER